MLGMIAKPLMFIYLAGSGGAFTPLKYSRTLEPYSVAHTPLFALPKDSENYKPNKIVEDTLKKLLDEKNLSSTEEILREYEEKVANKKIKLEERLLDLGVYIKS
ncbi:MAG: hypothetical protein AB8G05_27925 [Oligoflexales bacterium]